MRKSTLGLLAVLALIIAACGGVTPEAAGPSEGIEVHGDWTIDIYNEDGSLDRHLEFSNALTARGSEILARILIGDSLDLNRGNSIDPWALYFGDADTLDLGSGATIPGTSPCDTPNPLPSPIFMNPFHTTGCLVHDGSEIGGLPASAADSDDLVVLSGAVPTVQLSGSVVAESDGEITFVESLMETKHNSGILQMEPFTSKDVTTLDWNDDGTAGDGPVPVSAGQTVQIQVEISFTSG